MKRGGEVEPGCKGLGGTATIAFKLRSKYIYMPCEGLRPPHLPGIGENWGWAGGVTVSQ